MQKNLSQGFFYDLLQNKSSNYEQPVLQILGFQQSQNDPKQIIIRLSDQQSFLDCSLVGPYVIINDKITTSLDSRLSQSFKKFDFIKVVTYFYKINNKKISKLIIVIRKIVEEKQYHQKLGKPQQIIQFIQNQIAKSHIVKQAHEHAINNSNSHSHAQNSHSSGKKQNDVVIKIEEDIQAAQKCDTNQTTFNHSNQVNLNSHYHNPIKNQIKNQHLQQFTNQSSIMRQRQQRNSDQPLTLRQILNNQKGFFIGRLVRSKFNVKQTARDRPYSFFYLVFLDTRGDIVRITLGGNLALKQKNELKVGKCYYINQLEAYQTDKMSAPLIKTKDKQTKIHEVTASNIINKFEADYYHWEHEFDYIDTQYVDVIGIVENIEQKTSYTHPTQVRQVIRIVVRNHMKSVKISFWAQQIKSLETMNLKKGEPLILLDIKKKKKIYLDFTFQSDLIRLTKNSELHERFKHLLPTQQIADPKNIKQFHQLFQKQPGDNKIRTITATITKILQNRIIYRLCESCKSKMQKTAKQCTSCGSSLYIHKFNCYLEVADATASLNCVAFESMISLFSKTADQLSLVSDHQLKQLVDEITYKNYRISFENKNQRFLIRNIEPLQENQLIYQAANNIKWIKQIVFPIE